MKPTYLIITSNVCNHGGAQLLVLRRARYLKKRGYNVLIVVAYDNGNFILRDHFSDFTIIHIPILLQSISSIAYSQKNKIIQEVISAIASVTSTIQYIESHTLILTVWGEHIAHVYNAKHISYLLTEMDRYSSLRYYYDRCIIKNKLYNQELYGVSSVSINKIFGQGIDEVLSKQYVNVPFDESELIEVSEPSLNIQINKDVYVIGTISRLDKTYIEPLIRSAVSLAKQVPKQKFMLLIVGGSKTGNRQDYLVSTYTTASINVPNFEIIWTGYMSSLGKDVFRLFNVFVGMGTASINAISQNCLTLNIQPPEDLCSGFFGVDTDNFAYSTSGRLYTIIDKLKEAYILDENTKNDYIVSGRKLYESDYNLESCMNKLDCSLMTITECKTLPKCNYLMYESNRVFIKALKWVKHIINSLL